MSSAAVAEVCEGCCGMPEGPNKVGKFEPKLALANERVFLNWLGMTVTLGSIASALTAFGKASVEDKGAVQIMSSALAITAACFAIYAVNTFFWRRRRIRRRDEGNFDDPVGPYALSAILLIALTAVFATGAAKLSKNQAFSGL
mmetsp:Transcript_13613/g.21261  ORF Transcript_13613/g.21261 Transcript_13613/m.21261 type:complete len:144 (+) Transcript_13613:68-499(+)|eukprot:CAMPEP_0184295722 /NCGR_PEP_ID=MMETSP1049-20130417/6601_1 /TAXON_ID=77928 /ORGANISM="Proteomonas sulcata, Strain CCMP704" /LENGTH=143 /DNA_ID=CAMNT_0026604445 /DNA_START=65 /DNA_END=496 /DNA_ORIENTATION=-